MKMIFLVITFMAQFDTAFGQNFLTIREKIVPLSSTRTDVGKLARLVNESNRLSRYETEDETIEVVFSEEPCTDSGWNVPTDRVISFKSFPKATIKKEFALRNHQGLVVLRDDAFTEFHLDKKAGIVLVTSADDLSRVLFTPTDSDSALRCKGFPVFDLGSTIHRPADRFPAKNNDLSSLKRIITSLMWFKEQSPVNGWAMVYCKKGKAADCRAFAKRLEKLKSEYLGKEGSKFKIVIGGYRRQGEVETFLLPLSWESILPLPVFPSPFF